MKTIFCLLIIAFATFNSSAQCPITSDFTANPLLGCSLPHNVFFTDQSTNPDTWSWNFGDGGTSTLQNPIHNYTTAGTYTVELFITDTIFGCVSTSTETVIVEIPTADFSATTQFGCAPLSTSLTDASIGAVSWFWDFDDGNTSTIQNPTHVYTSPGVYNPSLTITSAYGCTSTEDIYLQVIGPNVNFGGDLLIGCSSFTTAFTDSTIFGAPITSWFWDFGDGGVEFIQNPTHLYSTPGVYDVELTVNDIDGCSRTFTQSQYVTLDQNYNEAETETVCNGEDYTFPDGTVQNNITTTVVHTSNLTTVNGGCDSIITTTLNVLPTAASTDTRTECSTLTWIDGLTYVTSNNSATFTDPGAAVNGCDSVITLNLTILNPAQSTDIIVMCDTLIWIDGLTYTSSNNIATFTYPGASANGCDSIVNLDLTITNSTTSTSNEIACDDFIWNGTTYTSSGTYFYNTLNADGCDSMATLNLTVNYSSISTTSITECSSYLWNGTTYTTSGIYSFTTMNAVGCDSIATLDLTINLPSTSTTTITQCIPYTWNGITYPTSGIYNFTSLNAVGCDSVQTLDLTIALPPASPIIAVTGNTTFCDGDSILLTSSQATGITWSNIETTPAIFVTNSGPYFVIYTDLNGCESISDTVIVTVNASPVVSVGPYSELCNTAAFFTITGGSPSGGVYTGPGVFGGIFDPSNAGAGIHTISYEFTNDIGCTDNATTTIEILDCAETEELIDIDLTLYPNPVSGILTIETNGSIIDIVYIYDATGSLIRTIPTNGALTQINMTDMSTGLYTIVVESKGAVYRSKILKH